MNRSFTITLAALFLMGCGTRAREEAQLSPREDVLVEENNSEWNGDCADHACIGAILRTELGPYRIVRESAVITQAIGYDEVNRLVIELQAEFWIRNHRPEVYELARRGEEEYAAAAEEWERTTGRPLPQMMAERN